MLVRKFNSYSQMEDMIFQIRKNLLLVYNLTLFQHIIIIDNTLTALKASSSGECAVEFASLVCSGSSGFCRELST